MLHFFFKLWRSISVIHTSHSRQQLETSHTAKEVDLNVGGSKYHIMVAFTFPTGLKSALIILNLRQVQTYCFSQKDFDTLID